MTTRRKAPQHPDLDPLLGEILAILSEEIHAAQRSSKLTARTSYGRVRGRIRGLDPQIGDRLEHLISTSARRKARQKEADQEIGFTKLQGVSNTWLGSCWEIHVDEDGELVNVGRIYPLAGDTYLYGEDQHESISLAHAIEALVLARRLELELEQGAA